MSSEHASIDRSTDDSVWVEAYRPDTLADVAGQNEITDQLQSYVETGELQSMLFAGGAGLGKTTCAIALAKDYFGDDWRNHFLELNASDDRGIDVVRDQIKEFARTPAEESVDTRIVFLDEADSLTDDAQAALRRTMEQYSSTAIFILSCNYSSQIIDPIQSRCAVFGFSPVSDRVIMSHVQTIADNEGITISNDAKNAIAYIADGDMRRAINALQGAAVDTDHVTETDVYRITSTPRPEEIEQLIQDALDGNYHRSRRQLNTLLNERGLSGGDVLETVHRLVWDFDIDDQTSMDIIDIISEADYRIKEGANEQIQLEAVLARISDAG